MNNYMTDEELQKLIADIEENDLVKAPPQIATGVFAKLEKKQKIAEYKRFRNRVIAAVAAILILTVLTPVWGSTLSNVLPEREHIDVAYINAEVEENDHKILPDSRIISDLVNGHYISNIFNGSEE